MRNDGALALAFVHIIMKAIIISHDFNFDAAT